MIVVKDRGCNRRQAIRRLLAWGGCTAMLVQTLLAAEGASPKWMKGLLPPGGMIIESAALETGNAKRRGLILWMIHPKRAHQPPNPLDRGCAESVYGDHWQGPTRLSLVDYREKKIINTITISNPAEDWAHPKGFNLPFYVSNEFYFVPKPNEHREGIPKILNLKDLTGEGVAGQFVLHDYVACAISLTAVFGYSPSKDKATQFPDEVVEKGKSNQAINWLAHTFSEKAIRPGYWDHTWWPGHGSGSAIRERVRFDRLRHLFVVELEAFPEHDLSEPQAPKRIERQK